MQSFELIICSKVEKLLTLFRINSHLVISYNAGVQVRINEFVQCVYGGILSVNTPKGERTKHILVENSFIAFRIFR